MFDMLADIVATDNDNALDKAVNAITAQLPSKLNRGYEVYICSDRQNVTWRKT